MQIRADVEKGAQVRKRRRKRPLIGWRPARRGAPAGSKPVNQGFKPLGLLEGHSPHIFPPSNDLPDECFCAMGGLVVDGVGPEKSLKQVDPDVMMRQFALNAIAAELVLKHFAPKLARSERTIAAFLPARVA